MTGYGSDGGAIRQPLNPVITVSQKHGEASGEGHRLDSQAVALVLSLARPLPPEMRDVPLLVVQRWHPDFLREETSGAINDQSLVFPISRDSASDIIGCLMVPKIFILG